MNVLKLNYVQIFHDASLTKTNKPLNRYFILKSVIFHSETSLFYTSIDLLTNYTDFGEDIFIREKSSLIDFQY